MSFRRSLANDNAHFGRLYQRNRVAVRKYLLNALRGNPEHVDDLTHEAFLRVWRSYGTRVRKFKDEEVQSLLITTARNCLTDMWRKDSKLVFWEAYVDTDAPLDGQQISDPYDQVADNEFRANLFAAAARRLTDGEWRVAFMGWVVQLSDAEIAATLGTTARTVRTLRCSARKKLKACARRDGYAITFSDAGGGDPSASTPGIGEVKV